jgi:hypothetical protein
MMNTEEIAARWDALARLVGYNKLVEDAQTLGERMYLRAARDAAREAYVRHGGEVHYEGDMQPIIVVNSRPPYIALSDEDIELMRAAVVERDAFHASMGGK